MISSKKILHTIFHDSEWYQDLWVSTTLYLTKKKKKKYFLHEYEKIELITFVNKNLNDTIGIAINNHFEIQTHLLNLLRKHKITEVLMINYFSPTDLYWIFPQEFPTSLYKDQQIKKYNFKFSQKSIIRGRGKIDDITFFFEDYSGILGIDSLKNKLNTLKISIKQKSLGDKFKTKMHEFLIKHPKKFLNYAEGDVYFLPKIRLEAQKLLNNLSSKLQSKFFEIPLTIGSTTFQLLIKSQKLIPSEKKILSQNSQKGFFRKYKNFPEFNIFSFIIGGRCQNNKPKNCYISLAGDMDIKACYTNILKNFSIPIKEIELFCNNIQLTISQFLEKNNFHKDYWIINFSTEFPFDQNFFPTRICDQEPDIDSDNLPNDHMKGLIYFKREVTKGFLTYNILKTLDKYWTNEQMEFLLNIKFTSAIFYTSVEKEIPLNNFVQTMEDIRYSKDNQNIATLAKLINNTIYGVLCSPFFTIGNVLIANLVTATARCQIFELEQLYDCHQSITDGGLVPQTDKEYPLDFSISYKAKNLSAFYFNKADYCYKTEDERIVVKIRGASQNNIKYQFAKSMLLNRSFTLKTRLYFDENYYKIGAYNHEYKSKGFLLTKDSIVGSIRRTAKLFTLSANHLHFKNHQEWKNYIVKKNKLLRNQQNLFEDILITEDTMKNINIELKKKKIPISRKKSKRIVKAQLPKEKKTILNHLIFALDEIIFELEKKSTIGYNNPAIKSLLKNHIFFYIPSSFYHKLYFNSIEINIDRVIKSQTIEFTHLTILQGEKSILNKIYNIILNQKEYFISDIIFVAHHYILTDVFIDFFTETIKAIDLQIPYQIFFFEKRSGNYYKERL